MSFGDQLEATLARGRRAAEALMRDAFAVHVPSGTTKDDAGLTVQTYQTRDVVSGKLQGRPRQGGAAVRTVNVGGVDRLVVEGGLHLPISADAPTAGAVGVGWEYELTTPGALTPPELAGSRWLVVAGTSKSSATARRLDVVRVDIVEEAAP